MNLPNQNSKNKAGLLGGIFSSLLIGLPAIPLAASAAPFSAVNPCPSIFYEEPHNNQVLVPQGCPPNAATLRQQGQMSGGQNGVVVPINPNVRGVNPIQPPLPATRQSPFVKRPRRGIATITPTAGRVNVKLQNNTNASVSYQAIGYTQPRILSGGQEIVLRNLPTPVTITMIREDAGFIHAMPISTSKNGTLTLSLDETANFSNSDTVLRIQSNGQVFLN
ncbi:MAG: hypothetical protein KME28_17035 [Pelatocladus maniniholoensis HA4357-MV3]|jgi:hypothetical protein|uniref:Uncharacterized protein n=1 Tax=Pelatocladus maniniholoensis HA4357-MV3 TaxID=1117104 RepID=A0A9E3HAV1_9NOST|nr:hypothetical protein [Pelatocladus maniniholoensis HA4357-MV3]BAZ68623.1 hypothetical protein NIES4106_33880 [Fischerella sp. NIES-4106]